MHDTPTHNLATHLPQAQEQLFNDSKDYFDHVLADIQAAKESVSLETYVFSNDIVGKKVAHALIDAAHRGVCVRVLVDGAGTPTAWRRLAKLLEKNKVQTKVFHPFPWQIWNWSRSVTRLPKLMKVLYLFLKVNSRNHRKIILIDDRIAYVGSLNVTRHHLSVSDGGQGWRDTAVRFTGVDLSPLSNAFIHAWTHKKFNERLRDAFRYVKKNPRFRLNDSRHRRRVLHKNLLGIMRRSKRRIWITNAYFIPDARLLKALKDAASFGVDVRILLPLKSNHVFMPWASSCFYHSLLKAGVRIFTYTPNMLHAKALMLDDWMLLGSSNLNHRSLLHDLEIDVNIKTLDAKQALENMFLEDLKNSRELSGKTWLKQSFGQRFMGRIMLYLKYWL